MIASISSSLCASFTISSEVVNMERKPVMASPISFNGCNTLNINITMINTTDAIAMKAKMYGAMIPARYAKNFLRYVTGLRNSVMTYTSPVFPSFKASPVTLFPTRSLDNSFLALSIFATAVFAPAFFCSLDFSFLAFSFLVSCAFSFLEASLLLSDFSLASLLLFESEEDSGKPEGEIPSGNSTSD